MLTKRKALITALALACVVGLGASTYFAPSSGASIENRVINGDFLIDQQNEGVAKTIATTGFFFDGNWRSRVTADVVSAFSEQVTTGFNNFAAMHEFKSLAASTMISTTEMTGGPRIEGASVADLAWGTSAAKNIMVTFWAQSSKTGTFCLAIGNSAGNRSYVATYSIPVANTPTYIVLSIPGDTTGTWLNTQSVAGMVVRFVVGAGSNFETTANAWSAANRLCVSGGTYIATTNNATLDVTNFRIRAGTFDVPYIPRPYPTELALAQRTYFKTFPQGTAPAQNAGVKGALSVVNPVALGRPSMVLPLPVTMARGTVQGIVATTYNPSAANANWRDITAGADVTVSVDPAVAITASGINNFNQVLIATGADVTTAADVLAIHFTISMSF